MLTPISIAGRVLGIATEVAQTGLRAAQQAVTIAQGQAQSTGAPKSQLTDAALARKVESELFRDPAIPKGKIDVNAVGRVVYLRGRANTAAQVADLARRTQAIPEVERVENLVEPPMTRPRAGGARRTSAGAKRRTPSRRINAEAKTTVGEPSPTDLAAKRQGRKPAPLGSTEPKKAGGKASARKASARKASASAAEPSPKDLAAKRQGRKPAPLGSSDTNGSGGS